MLESFFVNRHDGAKSTAETVALDISSKQFDSIKAKAQSSNELSDEALMAAYAHGNVKAFEQLYRRHKDPLLRFFLRQIESAAKAEELFQETWQSLIKNSLSYRSSAKFTTYLYTIARSRLVDFYRKQGKADFESLDNDETSIEPLAEIASQPENQRQVVELKAQLMAALDVLPSGQKEVFLLKFEAGMTVPEIAEVLALNPEAVKSRLRYCVANLKGFFSKQELMSEC